MFKMLLFILLPILLCKEVLPQLLIRRVLPHVHHECLARLVIDVRIQVIFLDAKAGGVHGRDHRVGNGHFAQLMGGQQKVLDVLKVFAEAFVLAELCHLKQLPLDLRSLI